MKKLLLALMATAALTASAQTLDKSNVIYAPDHQDAPALAPSRAADGYTIRFCNEISSWYTFKAAGTYVQYITIPAEIATQLAGNKLTSISYSVCLGGTSSTATKSGTIFVTENPDVAAVADLQLAAQASVKIRDSYLVEPYYQTGTFAAGEEYVIKENTPFSFGLMFDCATTDYPIGVDGYVANQFAGNVALYQGGTLASAVSMANEVGTNLMMYAVTKGEKTELIDVASVLGATFDGFALPIYKDTQSVQAYAAVNNLGNNAVTSLGYTYKINDGEAVATTCEVSVPAGKALYVPITLGTLPAGHNNVTLSFTSINGKEVAPIEGTLYYMSLEGVEPYDRKFVVEEGTGTWCGWCPRGIVGMDYMQETYPEKFIGIAVHSGDTFEVANYGSFISTYFDGFPSCIVNRDPNYNGDPSKDNLKKMYGYWADQVAPATIDLSYEVVEKNLEVKASANFAINDSHAYNMAIVLTEDGLKGVQTNYYAGGENGAMGGWESKSSKVSWVYTHTAKGINASFGTELTTAVEAGKDYECNASFLYIGAMSKKQFNLDNCHAIALLLDAQTGVVVNAAKIELATPDGIDDAIALPEGPATYYNVQGQKVANPQPGQLYIRVQGDKATKVVY